MQLRSLTSEDLPATQQLKPTSPRLLSLCSRVWEPRCLKPTSALRACAPQQEQPLRQSHCSLLLEKAHTAVKAQHNRNKTRSFLVVQWLRISLPTAGGVCWFLARELKISYASWPPPPKKKKTWNKSKILTNLIEAFKKCDASVSNYWHTSN